MPEGDTIARAAARLRESVLGRRVVAARVGDPAERGRRAGWSERRGLSIDAASLVGHEIIDVAARGKHLLVRFDDDRSLHSHLGMTGSWHVYAPGDPWRKPARQSAIAIETESACVVCFSPKVLELLSATALRRHRWISRLGPDILADEFDTAAVVPRFRPHGFLPIGEAVLHQGIVCGIGNVYKSEILFRLGIDPFARVRDLDDETLRAILSEARMLMRRNLDGRKRRTRFGRDGVSHAVYRRSGDRCLRCDTPIRMKRQGDHGRSTYYCPTCQPPRERKLTEPS